MFSKCIQKDYIRKNKIFLAIFLFLLFVIFPFFSETITLGGKDGWSKLSKMQGVCEGKGRFGYTCIELANDSRTVDSFTDMLLDFESRPFVDKAKKYDVERNELSLSTKSIMGHNSALSRGRGGISFRGNNGSIFGSEGAIGSFYIEFWLCPAVAENGEVVFAWRSSRNILNDILYQMISASFYRGHLEWTFTNLFDGYSKGDIVLEGVTRIIPEKWSHHSLSYNEENGMIEYRMNGMLEAIAYATSTGRDRGSVHQIFLGVPECIEICPKYTGMIDDFRIQKGEPLLYQNNSASLAYSKYNVRGGRIETQPLLTSTGAILESVNAVVDKPSETEIQFYVRSGDSFFNWTDSFPEWQPIVQGENISGVSGRYLQIAADLFPDGSGSVSPSITQVQINYSPLPEPLPPFSVQAIAGNESITVSWNASVDESVGGYYLYYGTSQGEYVSRNAREGASPINVGAASSVTLTGLRNGTIYYIAIAAYSKYDNRIIGPMSNEVYARPTLYGENYGK